MEIKNKIPIIKDLMADMGKSCGNHSVVGGKKLKNKVIKDEKDNR